MNMVGQALPVLLTHSTEDNGGSVVQKIMANGDKAAGT